MTPVPNSASSPSLDRAVAQVRADAGAWPCDDLGLLRICGPDAAEWLQTQTCNDVLALAPGQGQASAALDRKGRIHAPFSLHRWEDEFWLITPRACIAPLSNRFQEFTFLEDIRLADETAEMAFVAVQGPRTLPRLRRLLADDAASLPRDSHGVAPCRLGDTNAIAFRASLTGEDGFLLMTERADQGPLRDALVAAGIPIIPEDARDTLRIEAGIPLWGRDIDTNTRISETPLEQDAVSYDKGCYTGQEVVAKLRHRGTLRRALVGLLLDAPPFPPGAELRVDGAVVGRMAGGCWSPSLGRCIAMAYLDRDRRIPGERFALHVDDASPALDAEVVLLPFVSGTPRDAVARRCYAEALDRFDRDADDRDARVIELLDEAVLLDPTFEDAWETLGVTLHRQGRVDDAIAVMEQLARMNPRSVMAQTNLSVFYVSKGMIAEAEAAKARSAAIEMQQAQAAFDAERAAAQERARLEREAEERIRMFAEVLEFDPDDALATYGAGMARFQLGRYDDAAPFLQRATELQRDYSAAYLNLGKCCEFLSRTEKAIDAYQRGIAAAGRKGDLMPLREMERRLRALTQDAPTPEA